MEEDNHKTACPFPSTQVPAGHGRPGAGAEAGGAGSGGGSGPPRRPSAAARPRGLREAQGDARSWHGAIPPRGSTDLSGARPGLTGRGLRSPSARRRLERGPGRAASSAPGASEPGPGAAAAHPTAGPGGLDKGRGARGRTAGRRVATELRRALEGCGAAKTMRRVRAGSRAASAGAGRGRGEAARGGAAADAARALPLCARAPPRVLRKAQRRPSRSPWGPVACDPRPGGSLWGLGGES